MRPIDSAALHWRLESFHRPYHAALAEALVEARGRFGHAILIDLHSMPSIPVGQPGHGARIVVGDRFGGRAGDWRHDRVMSPEEARGGKEWVSRGRARGAPYHSQKNNKQKKKN